MVSFMYMYMHMLLFSLPPSSGLPGAYSPWPPAQSPSSPALCDPHCGKERNTHHCQASFIRSVIESRYPIKSNLDLKTRCRTMCEHSLHYVPSTILLIGLLFILYILHNCSFSTFIHCSCVLVSVHLVHIAVTSLLLYYLTNVLFILYILYKLITLYIYSSIYIVMHLLLFTLFPVR